MKTLVESFPFLIFKPLLHFFFILYVFLFLIAIFDFRIFLLIFFNTVLYLTFAYF